MPLFHLAYGHHQQELDIPGDYPVDWIEPPYIQPAVNPLQVVRDALTHPVDGRPLTSYLIISEKIRSILLDPANAALCAQAELLLYEASRAQLVCEAIEPALARGAVVVCDRFYDSTFAYQSGGRGIDEATVRAANTLGSCGYTPDLTLVFDLDPERALRRATRGGADRLEAEGACFQRRVREGYRRMVALEPGRVRMVDADGTPEEVFARTALALVPAIRALSSLDVPAFLARQADVERMMGTIAPSVEEGPHA